MEFVSIQRTQDNGFVIGAHNRNSHEHETYISTNINTTLEKVKELLEGENNNG